MVIVSPQQLWKFNSDCNFLDAIYISHQHADHFFGLPAILLRMWEGGRKRDIDIICQKNMKDSFYDFMDYAYKDFVKKFGYKINIIESKEGGEVKIKDISLSFSKTIHSGENLAVKIDDGKSVMVYSGDGSPVPNNIFYNNLDLLILETYMYDKEMIGHSSVLSAIEFAKENNSKCLALTHINRDLRKNEIDKIKEKIRDKNLKVIIPEPLDIYNL